MKYSRDSWIIYSLWSVNIVVRETRFLPMKEMQVSWRGFEVKPCKSEKLWNVDFIAVKFISSQLCYGETKSRESPVWSAPYFLYPSRHGIIFKRQTLAYSSPETTKNRWWTWSVRHLITWFMKWLQNVTCRDPDSLFQTLFSGSKLCSFSNEDAPNSLFGENAGENSNYTKFNSKLTNYVKIISNWEGGHFLGLSK